MPKISDLSLRTKLIGQTVVVVSIMGIVFSTIFPQLQISSAKAESFNKLDIVNQLLNHYLEDPLNFIDKTSADLILNGLDSIETIEFVTVYDADKQLFSVFQENNYNGFLKANNDKLPQLEKHIKTELNELILLYEPILSVDKEVGFLLIAFNTDNIIKTANEAQSFAIGITLISVIASILISFFVSGTILKTVNQLIAFFKSMAEGKGDLTRRLSIESKDEFGLLASEFNRFLDTQNAMIKEIKLLTETVNDKINLIEKLSLENNHLISNLNKILDLILNIVNKLFDGAEVNVESAKNATSQSENSIKISLSSQKAIEKSIGEMQSIKNEMSQLESDMSNLHERSKQIRSISDALKDISDKTTILALNTSIEANKAGDYGSGFLVISEEIQRLAEQGLKSLDDINKIIYMTQKNLDFSYNLTKSASHRVDEGMDSINRTGEQIKDSVNSVKTNVEYIKEVLEMAQEQKNRVKDIVNNINDSVNNIGHIKNSNDNTLQSVREQKSQIDRLTKLVSNFKTS